jgi:sarcosine oxidase
MAQAFDCIVIGCGGFGSGALYHLAKRGANVLGIERFEAVHDLGSSHGESRIIRKAYFEHPDYVPLLHDAFDLWRQLESESGQALLHECGLFIAGPAKGQAISGAKRAAKIHSLPIESISAAEAGHSFGGFHIPDACEIVVESAAGFLRVEACVAAHLQQAQKLGATLQTGETVLDWHTNGTTCRVTTDQGRYSSRSLIVTAGAWTNQLLNQFQIPLRVVRKLMFWHESSNPAFRLENNARAFFFELPDGEFYGFPCLDGRTIKVARHTGGLDVSDPSLFDRDWSSDDHRAVAEFIQRCMPGVATSPSRHAACLYTMTPDGHFVIDQHPNYDNVVIGAGFSGHGFKFTGVLGRVLAELSLEGITDSPIDFLRLDRF